MSHSVDIFLAVLPALFSGFIETLKLALAGIVWGSILGVGLGTLRGQYVRIATPIIGGYLHILRGTPFLVQLYIIYFVLPNTGWPLLQFDSSTAATIGLGIYTSSYVTEIVSGAIRAIPRGQWEAAFALGFTRLKTLRLIILPQSVGLMLPSLGGVYVTLIKATSIVSVVGIAELMRQAEIQIVRFPGDILFIYAIAGALYFAFCFPVLILVGRLEKRATRGLQVRV
ncbi:MAG TPA: amino acid ABC transporter permease [Mesorhizobium sp.]|jgi:polar amino acid transport system permease protein|uniref:amino acid ABC transporter permease n=1 Tax=Mesorhizobium sp. TaxID=1871066 RepID=UPI002DDCC6D0|nr:amino acid ABC transporter permease [Mesorhizobium sp.]HEV2506975.1 amino acid ABC transporter permease [Mesorhizobium sp.]